MSPRLCFKIAAPTRNQPKLVANKPGHERKRERECVCVCERERRRESEKRGRERVKI